jgi:ferrochelatase
VSIIKAGDPYQFQIQESVGKIIEGLSRADLDYIISYQSKVGPVKWLEPSTESEIVRASKEKVDLILVPISFVSEHVETLVELDVEYGEIAKQGGIRYIRVPALRDHPYFIESMSEILKKALLSEFSVGCNSYNGKSTCPKSFSKCPNKLYTQI